LEEIKVADRKTAGKEEPVYTLEEFLSAGTSVFGRETRQECIVAAFRLAKKTEATINEAKKLVNEFCKKEVQ